MAKKKKPLGQKKQMAGNLYTRLSSAQYLHSNPDNLYGIVDSGRGFYASQKGNFNQSAIEKLEQIANQSRILEQEFYLDMGVKSPREFEDKFLLKRNGANGGKSFSQVILEVLLEGKYWFNFKTGKEYLLFVDAIPKVYNLDNFAQSIFQDANNTTKKNIPHNSRKNLRDHFMRYVSSISKKKIQTEFEKGLITSFNRIRWTDPKTGIFDTQLSLKKINIKSGENEYAKTFFKQTMKLFGKNLIVESELNEILRVFQSALKQNYPAVTQKQIQKASERLCKSIERNIIEASFSSKSGGIGAILEMSLEIAGLGKAVGNETNEKGQKLAYDLEIKGLRSGKIYRIQLKNSLDMDKMNIKIQDTVSLETFKEKASQLNDPSKLNEILYMIINLQYLSKFGLNKKGEPNHLNLKRSSLNYKAQELEAYEQSLISAVAYFFLGQNLWNEKKQSKANIGNLFFILKGKYLIPISLFIQVFIEALRSPYTASSGIRTLGGVQHPGITGLSGSKTNAVALQREKRKALRSVFGGKGYNPRTRITKGYSYPEPLVEVGQRAFQETAKSVKINGLHFFTNLKLLEKNLDKYRK